MTQWQRHTGVSANCVQLNRQVIKWRLFFATPVAQKNYTKNILTSSILHANQKHTDRYHLSNCIWFLTTLMVTLRLPVSCEETSVVASPQWLAPNINSEAGWPSASPTRVNLCSQLSVARGDTAAQRTAQLTTCWADEPCHVAHTDTHNYSHICGNK